MEPAKAGSATRSRSLELTPRQRQVLRLIAAGKTNADIGESLGISLDGAKWHVSEILAKLDVATREEAADWWRAQRAGARAMRIARAVLLGVARLKLAGAIAGTALGVTAVAVGMIALRDRGDGGGPGATPTTAALVNDVPADCPASSSAVIHPALRPAAGSGPVYMNLGVHPVAGQRTLAYQAPDQRQTYPPAGWGEESVIFLVAPSYQQPVRLSGTSLDGSAQVQFAGPDEAVLLPLGAQQQTGFPVMSVTADGWRMYAVGVLIRLDHPGCYVINLSGPGLDERITFWAALQTVVPTPTPTVSAASPTPRPIIEWMPYLRMLGRSYLAIGTGFAAGSKPPVSMDPASAGRQVGTVLVNVRDPSFDFSQPAPDGSSAILPAGTPVYALEGYREDFRLLAETDYGWRVFETDGLNGAKTIADALDIRGKVQSVIARRYDRNDGFQTVVGEVTQSDRVSALVDLLLAQAVSFTGSATQPTATDPPQLQLTFRLQDGTSTVRVLYVGGWEWSQGIPVTPEFFSRIEASFAGGN